MRREFEVSSLPEGGEAKTVLIAEDNTVTRRCLTGYLEVLGYRVVAAVANGKEAIAETKKLNPSLVLMDVKMPGMSGIEAARAITAISPLPIILVTGISSSELAEEAVEAGVFAYLVKPVTKKHLLPAIILALVRYEQFRKLKEEVKDLQDAMEARKFIERAKGILMKRCNIDEAEAFKLLQAHSQKENKKMRDIAMMVIEASKLI